MAEDIMSLSNDLVYNGAMQCGSEQVAEAKLHLPHYHQLQALASGPGLEIQDKQQQQEFPNWLLQVRRGGPSAGKEGDVIVPSS